MKAREFLKRGLALVLSLLTVGTMGISTLADEEALDGTLTQDEVESETEASDEVTNDRDGNGVIDRYKVVWEAENYSQYSAGETEIPVELQNVKGEGESAVSFSDVSITEDGKGYSLSGTKATLDTASPYFCWNYTNADVNTGVGSSSGNKNVKYTWTFEVSSAGMYNLKLGYLPLIGSQEIKRNIYIDGVIPYYEASSVALFRQYVEVLENGEIQKTDVGEKFEGDDIRPNVVEYYGWQETLVYDPQLRETLPLQFYLSEGTHTISLEMISQPMLISSITFVPAEELITYSEYKQNNTSVPMGKDNLKLEAENLIGRNSQAVRRDYNTEPTSEPYSYSAKLLNEMGDTNWDDAGQSATWSIDIQSEGLYAIGFHVNQDYNEGMPSYRRLEINGQMPFAECKALRFEYNSRYYNMTLCDANGEPYLFNLKPGDKLTLTVVMGDTGEIITDLEDVVNTIQDLYSSIRILTGSDPDEEYDYKFNKFIPDINSTLMGIKRDLDAICDKIIKTSNNDRPGMVTNLSSTGDMFLQLHDDNDLIAGYFAEIQQAATDITSWITQMESQPLAIECIYVAPSEADFKIKKSGFFDRFIAFVQNLWLSFFKDYNNVGMISGEGDTVEVWIGRGAEWCEIFREQVRREFAKEYTNIGVSINVLPSGQITSSGTNLLMLSYISGNAPDVIMGGGANDAIEFAIRDAMYPVSDFADFEEVSRRFYPQLFDAIKYNGKYYGLPESMNFLCMFYRTDIFEKLELKIPDTWDELFGTVMPVLYENDMQFWYAGGYDVLLYQNGGSFYRDDVASDGVTYENIRSALDTTAAYDAFVQWTEFYLVEGVPFAANFFNQFKSGDVPIGMGVFADYMNLLIAAPSIQGKWAIAPVPGTTYVGDDGNTYVDYSSTGIGGSYCYILGSTDCPESSWEVLKWWTRADTQSFFATEVEAIVGRDARWLSANLEAFNKMPWEGDQATVIETAQKRAVVMPNVLGGYYNARYVSNAFTRVAVNRTDRARDALVYAIDAINTELWAKREEYKQPVPDEAYLIS